MEADPDLALLVARYASGVDARQVEEVVSCFAPDGVLEIDGGTVVLRGHDELRAAFGRALDPAAERLGRASTHLMANIVVVARQGSTARVRSQGVAFLHRGEQVVVRGLWYEDECVRHAKGWRFARRRHRAAWQYAVPAGTVGPPQAFLSSGPGGSPTTEAGEERGGTG